MLISGVKIYKNCHIIIKQSERDINDEVNQRIVIASHSLLVRPDHVAVFGKVLGSATAILFSRIKSFGTGIDADPNFPLILRCCKFLLLLY